ncbi:MAG: tetratricopeptide repeat-containing protein, partial [Gammaproteobacteria bacterium]
MSVKSLRAFIVRPFGTKKDRNRNEVNFDAVQEQLIVPALECVGVDGRTTLDILRAGNIRVDMFQRLLTADLVVADLSIDNANVFYELGIRHALREKRTFMLRCEGDKYPFDLQTDRYFIYQRENPAASLEQLVAALRQTLNSEEQDSPVFKLLPSLQAQDRSRFLAVPMDFREEVEQASASRQAGDLELLGVEARGLEWESEGLRVVGRAQFRLKAFKGARAT